MSQIRGIDFSFRIDVFSYPHKYDTHNSILWIPHRTGSRALLFSSNESLSSRFQINSKMSQNLSRKVPIIIHNGKEICSVGSSTKFEHLSFDVIVVLILDRLAIHHTVDVAFAHEFIMVLVGALLERLIRIRTRPDLGLPSTDCL